MREDLGSWFLVLINGMGEGAGMSTFYHTQDIFTWRIASPKHQQHPLGNTTWSISTFKDLCKRNITSFTVAIRFKIFDNLQRPWYPKFKAQAGRQLWYLPSNPNITCYQEVLPDVIGAESWTCYRKSKSSALELPAYLKTVKELELTLLP